MSARPGAPPTESVVASTSSVILMLAASSRQALQRRREAQADQTRMQLLADGAQLAVADVLQFLDRACVKACGGIGVDGGEFVRLIDQARGDEQLRLHRLA
jgi:hypothetical protein